jgi:hypothetical protein
MIKICFCQNNVSVGQIGMQFLRIELDGFKGIGFCQVKRSNTRPMACTSVTKGQDLYQ